MNSKCGIQSKRRCESHIYEWVLGSHFESLIDLEQEMGQWSLMLRSGTLTSMITSGLFVYILVNKTGVVDVTSV